MNSGALAGESQERQQLLLLLVALSARACIVWHPAPPSMTLHANVKQIPVSISIVSYVYHL